MTESHTLEVNRSDWQKTRLVSAPLSSGLETGEVLLRIDRLALTSNNISYAAAGDALGYWGFFPAEAGWGRIPAMGWADVLRSAHAEIEEGERVWGFFPFSTHLKIQAGKVSAEQFHDVSAHRAQYAPVYARFDRAQANPIYDPLREDQDSLLRGLFMTSWLVEDFLNEKEAFGAQACIVTSASSKTSIALAHRLKARGKLTIVGITSPHNVNFCAALGLYDTVMTYDAIAGMDAAVPAVVVDMAGSAEVLGQLHRHYRDNLRYSCRVGATHYADAGSVEGLPGAAPEFFFAPGHIQTRSDELGAAALMLRLGTDYVQFRAESDGWLQVKRSYGPEAVRETYQAVLAGETEPSTGQIISLWPQA
tara:strand:- start:32144 stop:33235 length:1092 start_codon:yes stop_codon:yes gene_type:complete